MAHRRSDFHHWRMSFAILLIVATPLRAQTIYRDTPAQAFAAAYPAYLLLLDGYRRYDEAAARDLGTFWEHFETTDDKSIPRFMRMAPREIWPISVMALTDLALATLARGDKDVGNRHFKIAERWVDQILASNASPSIPLNRFARKWYLAAIWLRFARAEGEEASTLLERARKVFPDDPEVLLSSGTFEAMELTRKRLERGNRRPRGELTSHYGMPGPEMQLIRATGYFREVIRLDPDNVEARVRLAWLRFSQKSLDFAAGLPLLKEARALAPKPPLSYLAALFAGRIEEELKHLDAAATWYRTALADCPLAQTARVGLSHVQLDQDQAVTARNTLRPLIRSSRPDDACEPDPWRTYEFGQAWRLTDWIAAMRKDVREPTEGSQP